MFRRIVAIIPDGPTDNGVVFLLHEAIVALVIWPASRKGDLLLVAIPQEMIVDKF